MMKFMLLCCLKAATLGILLAQNVDFVEPVHLLQEDESQNGVGSQPEVIGGESLPKGEEPFVSGDLDDDICGSLVFWFTVDHFHVLDSGLGDIDRHGRGRGDQTREHGSQEMAENAIVDVTCQRK